MTPTKPAEFSFFVGVDNANVKLAFIIGNVLEHLVEEPGHRGQNALIFLNRLIEKALEHAGNHGFPPKVQILHGKHLVFGKGPSSELFEIKPCSHFPKVILAKIVEALKHAFQGKAEVVLVEDHTP